MQKNNNDEEFSIKWELNYYRNNITENELSELEPKSIY